MKIAFVLTEDWFFCSHFMDRALAAKEAGHDVVVIVHTNKHAEEIRSKKLRLIPLCLDRRSVNPFKELHVVWQIYRAYLAERPDIVHHVALKPVLYGTIAAKLAGIKRIVNAPVGMGYIFTSQSFKASFLRLLVASGLRALLNPHGSKVIFENKDDLENLIAQGYVRRGDAVLIRGAGIDTDFYRPSPEPEGTPVVVLTARMLWDKGVGEFVEAARLLRAKGVKARFLLVGAPDTLNPSTIPEEKLRQWKASGDVEVLGFQSDIRRIIAGSHIVCLPSYREGLPKSLLEALACGKPVVTTDVSGCREVVRDGVNGLLVPARNAGALAAALEKLLGSPEERARMGQAGRLMAEEEFDKRHVIAETLRVYNALARRAAKEPDK
ncbi:MAG: glycosyltransferase family 4 protein [Bdellovibrionales bacterium]